MITTPKIDWVRKLHAALMAYGYVLLSEKDGNAVFRAGNGAEAEFEKDGKNIVLVADGSEWAIRQIAEILSGHPGFHLEPNDKARKDDRAVSPWVISIKESIHESRDVVKRVLLQ